MEARTLLALGVHVGGSYSRSGGRFAKSSGFFKTSSCTCQSLSAAHPRVLPPLLHPHQNQEDWHAFNFVVDVCFLLDLAARFMTAYHDDRADTMVYEPLQIARHYSRGLLVFDLIASVPLTIVSFVGAGARVLSPFDAVLLLFLLLLLLLLLRLRRSRAAGLRG